MDNIVLLPMWANLLFIAAIMTLIGLAVSKKINLKQAWGVLSAEVSFYVISAIVVMTEAVVFFAMAPMQELSASYLITIGVMMFLAFLVSALGSMDSNNKKILLLTVWGIFLMLVTLVTLIYCSVTFAAIWVATLTAFGFIGFKLFSAPAKK